MMNPRVAYTPMGMFLQMEKIKNVRNSLWNEKVIYRASEMFVIQKKDLLKTSKLFAKSRDKEREMLLSQDPILKTALELGREFFKEWLAKRTEIDKAKRAMKEKDGVDAKELEEDLQRWKEQRMEKFKVAMRQKLDHLEQIDELGVDGL